VRFEDYADPSFVPDSATVEAFQYQDDISTREAKQRGVIR
jgi:hypothetical protein